MKCRYGTLSLSSLPFLSLPFLSLPFPLFAFLSIFFVSIPFSGTPLQIGLGGLGGAVSFLIGSRPTNCFLRILSRKSLTPLRYSGMHCDPYWPCNMLVWYFSQKKWRYGFELAKQVPIWHTVPFQPCEDYTTICDMCMMLDSRNVSTSRKLKAIYSRIVYSFYINLQSDRCIFF